MEILKNNIFYVRIRGTDCAAYNAYLVKGEKSALIECVHEDMADEYIKNIEEIMPVGDIDFLILNHAETCYAGTISRITELNPDIKIVATIAAIRNLKEITNSTFNEYIAKDGGTLDLGGAELKFLIAPNLHWPDSMFTYYEEEKTLFTCSAFSADCDGESDFEEYTLAAKRYYEKMLSPFADYVRNGIKRIAETQTDMICPSRGSVLKQHTVTAIDNYREWSAEKAKTKKTAAVIYASLNGCTRQLAETIASALNNKGIKTVCMDVSVCGAEKAVEAIHAADAFAFGSPTVNKNALKPMWDVITSIDSISKKSTPCMVFGSYGWSGEGMTLMQTYLAAIKMRMSGKPFGCYFRPSQDDIEQLKCRAEEFAKEILSNNLTL